MHEATKEKLKQFAGVRTWTSKHWADFGRFYQFTGEAYRNGDTSIDFDEFCQVIKDANVSNSEVHTDIFHEYYGRYENAIEAIKV